MLLSHELLHTMTPGMASSETSRVTLRLEEAAQNAALAVQRWQEQVLSLQARPALRTASPIIPQPVPKPVAIWHAASPRRSIGSIWSNRGYRAASARRSTSNTNTFSDGYVRIASRAKAASPAAISGPPRATETDLLARPSPSEQTHGGTTLGDLQHDPRTGVPGSYSAREADAVEDIERKQINVNMQPRPDAELASGSVNGGASSTSSELDHSRTGRCVESGDESVVDLDFDLESPARLSPDPPSHYDLVGTNADLFASFEISRRSFSPRQDDLLDPGLDMQDSDDEMACGQSFACAFYPGSAHINERPVHNRPYHDSTEEISASRFSVLPAAGEISSSQPYLTENLDRECSPNRIQETGHKPSASRLDLPESCNETLSQNATRGASHEASASQPEVPESSHESSSQLGNGKTIHETSAHQPDLKDEQANDVHHEPNNAINLLSDDHHGYAENEPRQKASNGILHRNDLHHDRDDEKHPKISTLDSMPLHHSLHHDPRVGGVVPAKNGTCRSSDASALNLDSSVDDTTGSLDLRADKDPGRSRWNFAFPFEIKNRINKLIDRRQIKHCTVSDAETQTISPTSRLAPFVSDFDGTGRRDFAPTKESLVHVLPAIADCVHKSNLTQPCHNASDVHLSRKIQTDAMDVDVSDQEHRDCAVLDVAFEPQSGSRANLYPYALPPDQQDEDCAVSDATFDQHIGNGAAVEVLAHFEQEGGTRANSNVLDDQYEHHIHADTATSLPQDNDREAESDDTDYFDLDDGYHLQGDAYLHFHDGNHSRDDLQLQQVNGGSMKSDPSPNSIIQEQNIDFDSSVARLSRSKKRKLHRDDDFREKNANPEILVLASTRHQKKRKVLPVSPLITASTNKNRLRNKSTSRKASSWKTSNLTDPAGSFRPLFPKLVRKYRSSPEISNISAAPVIPASAKGISNPQPVPAFSHTALLSTPPSLRRGSNSSSLTSISSIQSSDIPFAVEFNEEPDNAPIESLFKNESFLTYEGSSPIKSAKDKSENGILEDPFDENLKQLPCTIIKTESNDFFPLSASPKSSDHHNVMCKPQSSLIVRSFPGFYGTLLDTAYADQPAGPSWGDQSNTTISKPKASMTPLSFPELKRTTSEPEASTDRDSLERTTSELKALKNTESARPTRRSRHSFVMPDVNIRNSNKEGRRGPCPQLRREFGQPSRLPVQTINSLQLWRSWKGASNDISTVAWAPDGAKFAVGATAHSNAEDRAYNRPCNLLVGDLERMKLWELPDHRTALRCLHSHTAQASYGDPYIYQSLHEIAYSINGRKLYTASRDSTVRVWDVADGAAYQCREIWEHDAEVTCVEVGPLAVATAAEQVEDSVRVYRGDEPPLLLASQRACHLPSTKILPDCLRWGPTQHSGQYLLGGFSMRHSDSNHKGGQLCLWDVNKGVELAVRPTTFDATAVAWHPQEPLFAAGGTCRSKGGPRNTRTAVRVWDYRMPLQYISEVDSPAQEMGEVSFHPHNRRIVAAACSDESSYIWDCRFSDRPLHRFHHSESGDEMCVGFSAWGVHGSLYYSGASDGLVKAWDIRRHPDDACVQDVAQVGAPITYGQFSPDFTNLLVGDSVGAFHILSAGPVGEGQFWLARAPTGSGEAVVIADSDDDEGRLQPARDLVQSGQVFIDPDLGAVTLSEEAESSMQHCRRTTLTRRNLHGHKPAAEPVDNGLPSREMLQEDHWWPRLGEDEIYESRMGRRKVEEDQGRDQHC